MHAMWVFFLCIYYTVLDITLHCPAVCISTFSPKSIFISSTKRSITQGSLQNILLMKANEGRSLMQQWQSRDKHALHAPFLNLSAILISFSTLPFHGMMYTKTITFDHQLFVKLVENICWSQRTVVETGLCMLWKLSFNYSFQTMPVTGGRYSQNYYAGESK